MNLSICCLNVRGLGDNLKRRQLFNWLRMQKHSIYMLQEAHCSESTNSMWSAEWGYRTIFSGQDSSKCGVAILFNNTFSFEIRKFFSDPNGRFIICDIETEQKCVTLATLFGGFLGENVQMKIMNNINASVTNALPLDVKP